MSPILDGHHPQVLRFPRVSGDEPKLLPVTLTVDAFSPRERG